MNKNNLAINIADRGLYISDVLVQIPNFKNSLKIHYFTNFKTISNIFSFCGKNNLAVRPSL